MDTNSSHRHTFGMSLTTIKVTVELRDALKAQAGHHNRNIGEHLRHLLEAEARRDRFRQVQEAMTKVPPDEEYIRELREWTSDAWT